MQAYATGHRFDSKNHEWVYMKDFLSLSFSYMTFVLKKKLDEEDWLSKPDISFDKEMYNYILKRQTSFTEDLKLMLDHEKLASILKNLEAIDKGLIE